MASASAQDHGDVGPGRVPAVRQAPVASGASAPAGGIESSVDAASLGGAMFSPFARPSLQARHGGPSDRRADDEEPGFGATLAAVLGGLAALALGWRSLHAQR